MIRKPSISRIAPTVAAVAVAVVSVVACTPSSGTTTTTTTTTAPACVPASIRAAFFYPWFIPNTWGGRTHYTPSLGWYDSTDPAIIDQQLSMATNARLDALISSWWGPGSATDKALPLLLAGAHRAAAAGHTIKFATYYELESTGDPSPFDIASNLTYLHDHYFDDSAYLHVGGKPVVFVYADGLDGAYMATRWAQAKALFGGNVYVVLKVFSGWRTAADQPDSWHQYGPASSYASMLPYSATISPGFWKNTEATPRLNRDPAQFRSDAAKMASSGAFWQLVTTWNEWGEGTAVEPSVEFGFTYLDALAALPRANAC